MPKVIKVKTFELRILKTEEKEMIQMFQNHGVCVLNKILTGKQPSKYKKLNFNEKTKMRVFKLLV
jgi:hypothetical protein